MAVILTGNYRFWQAKYYNSVSFYTILAHFWIFWTGTLSKMTGNFKILAKVLVLYKYIVCTYMFKREVPAGMRNHSLITMMSLPTWNRTDYKGLLNQVFSAHLGTYYHTLPPFPFHTFSQTWKGTSKADQIWQFQHKNGIFGVVCMHFFYLPSKKFPYPCPPLPVQHPPFVHTTNEFLFKSTSPSVSLSRLVCSSTLVIVPLPQHSGIYPI